MGLATSSVTPGQQQQLTEITMHDPSWVKWARSLDPVRWEAWRQRADRILARDPRPGERSIEGIERSLEAAWREMTRQADEVETTQEPVIIPIRRSTAGRLKLDWS